MKKCKSCKKPFYPSKTTQSVCSLGCAVKLAEQKEGKMVLRRAEKEGIKQLAISLKTLGDYKKELQIEVNKIVRLIDEGCKCLACGVTNAKFDASHFRGVGAWDNLRFNLHNIYSGCARCNTYQNGNLIKFREGIIETFGDSQMAYIDDLNVIYPIVKLNKDELAERTKTAKKIVKELIELNKSAKLPRNSEERIAFRTKFNKMLDIYS